MKYISLRRLLHHHLYDLLPASEDQKELLPSIQIALDDETTATMEMTVRAEEGPRLESDSFGVKGLDGILEQLRAFREITKSKMIFVAINGPNEQRRRAILAALGHELSDEPDHIGWNLKRLRLMKDIAEKGHFHDVFQHPDAIGTLKVIS